MTSHGPCQRCDDLQEEVRQLRRELGMIRNRNMAYRLRLKYGMTAQCADLLEALYGANGRVLSSEFLADTIPSDSRELDVDVVKVQICRVRKAIGRQAVENVRGLGYRITDLGKLMVQEALEG